MKLYDVSDGFFLNLLLAGYFYWRRRKINFFNKRLRLGQWIGQFGMEKRDDRLT